MNVKKRLLDGPRMHRAIRRMAIEILEKNRGTDDLIIVGKRAVGGHVFAVHGCWWHRRERGEPRDLRTQLRP